MKHRFFIFLAIILCCEYAGMAQRQDSTGIRMLSADSVAVKKAPATDTSGMRRHSPRRAAIRSAILPGWGQAYNHKYWKIPIVYAALGITGNVLRYNIKEYQKVRFAYITLRDTVKADYDKVDPQLRPFLDAGQNGLYALRNYRNEFRKNIDYSVLFVLLFWGLNVVDATVDAHLKEFDISSDLSMKIKPSINTLPNTMGLSLVFTIGPHREGRGFLSR